MDTLAPAIDAVKTFLAALEARDLPRAEALLAKGCIMTFPGARLTSLEALVAFAKPRYRHVSKTFLGFEGFSDGAVTVVYARGTLSGAWPDGTAFEGVRFIDRFEIEGGKIRRQDVWNDLAEARHA
ncbi:MAG: nuclear transport factor 2 family protein [Pseudomonadota bacterium]